MPASLDTTYHVSGVQRDDHPQYALGAGVYNVKRFGAQGNGVTDDTAAIQAALTAAAATGGRVTIPAGVFIVSGSLTVGAGVRVSGVSQGAPPGATQSGSTLRAAASATFDHILGVTQASQLNYSVTIDNLVLDGNKANGATVSHGFYGLSLNDSIIDSVRIVNCSGNAITLDGAVGFLGAATKVVNSFVRNCGGHGYNQTSNATDSILTGNDFGQCTGRAYYINGIHAAVVGCIGWGSGSGIVVDSSGGLVWIAGCRFDQNQNQGAWFLAHNITMTGCLIYDNSVAGTNSQPGILVDSGSADVVITGCRSVGGLNGGTQQKYGLQVLGTGGSRGALTVSNCDFTGNGTAAVSYAGMSTAGDVFRGVLGYNPVGVVSPGVPASGSPVAAVQYDQTFYVSTVAGTTSCSMAIQGGPTVPFIASTAQVVAVRVPAGQTVTPTYTGTAPTWVVEGE